MTMRTPALMLCVLLATACAVGEGAGAEPEEGGGTVLGVGAGPDPESTLLAEILAGHLVAEGFDAEVVAFPTAQGARRAIEEGRVDLRPAYTGEAWLQVLGRADPPSSAEASFSAVREHDEEHEGIVWLAPPFGDGVAEPPADATFAFVVSPALHESGVESVSQLATRLSEEPESVLCVDHDFATRNDGLPAVLSAYSVRSDQPVLAAAPQDAAAGVAAGDCVAGLTVATDGAAWSLGAWPLVDDLGVFPAFVVAPQVRAEVLDEHPRIRAALEPFVEGVTTRRLGGWNARILAGEPIGEVAADAADELRREAGRDTAG